MDTVDANTAGKDFLDFALTFYAMTQRQYRQANQIKANTKAFQAMMALTQETAGNGGLFTMSALAKELHITKQQMTKLVNDMEEKKVVERIHDSKNRRLVYIRTSEYGSRLMEELKSQMLGSTVEAIGRLSAAEINELDYCLNTLQKLLRKLDIELSAPSGLMM